MLTGYLGVGGTPVVVDSLGHKTVYPAYRIDEAAGLFDFLTYRQRLEPLGTVGVTVHLHRKGWARSGEVLLYQSTGRLYRTRTSHVILGSSWRSLRQLRREIDFSFFTAPELDRPLFSSRKPPPKLSGTFPPPKNAPFFLWFPDQSVKAVRRSGTTVSLYATELKEFAPFVLGKLRADVQFPTEQAAESFARMFPRIDNPASLDPAVTVDIDRSLKPVMTKRRIAILAGVSVPMGLVFAATVILAIRDAGLRVLWELGAGASLSFLVGFVYFFLERARKEEVSLRENWPRILVDRWVEEFPAHASGFPSVMKDLGLTLDRTTESLAPFDAYLRRLPAETFFGVMALQAAAYVGAVFLDTVGRNTPWEWRFVDEAGHRVLWFETAKYWISPLVLVREVWEKKDPVSLQESTGKFAKEIQVELAFQPRAEFLASGFLANDAGFTAFAERILKEVDTAAPESHVLEESHFRVRRLAWGPFRIQFVELEVERATGPVFIPIVVIPHVFASQPVVGRLDGTSPRHQAREDVAVVRLDGNELVPVGIQLWDYLSHGPGFAQRSGPLTFELSVISDGGQIVTPRMRETRQEMKDHLAPLEATPEGIPLGPYANVLGRIVSIAELMNPVGNTPMWRLGLDVSGFRIDVLVRKDRCDGHPETGHYFSGSCWLVGSLEAAARADASYIR